MVVATENGDSIESGRVDVCVETSETPGWLDDSRLNLGLVRDPAMAQLMGTSISWLFQITLPSG